jgi:hypothetical protein
VDSDTAQKILMCVQITCVAVLAQLGFFVFWLGYHFVRGR